MSEIKTKFINDPENITSELLEGYVLAYPDKVKLAAENIVVRVNPKSPDKVAIVTLGGSGHEPALSGFVGEGMLDASVVGDIFAAPDPQACLEAIKTADRGRGVLYIVQNHAGDMLAGDMTMERCARERLNVKRVVVQEDIAIAPRSDPEDRRGLVGCVPLYKIAGAAAAEGKSLDEVETVARRFADNMAGIHVGGNLASQRIFNFTNIPYLQQSKAVKPGSGLIPSAEDSSIAETVILPLVKGTDL